MRREITSYKITYRNGNIKKQLKSGVRTVLETSTQLNVRFEALNVCKKNLVPHFLFRCFRLR